MNRIIDQNECAVMIRKALKQAFPKTKFSVRGKSFSMGHSITARWTDGPTQKQVKPILDRFVSSGFDGMTDCSYSCGERTVNGERVTVNGGHVNAYREVSRGVRAMIVAKLAAECGIEGVTLSEQYGDIDNGDCRVPFVWHSHWLSADYMTMNDFLAKKHVLVSGRGEWFARLVYAIECCISLEEAQPIEADLLPEYIDLTATVSTGRAEEFEPRQNMFEGHAALDELLTQQPAPAAPPAPATAPVLNCSIGRSYPRLTQTPTTNVRFVQ